MYWLLDDLTRIRLEAAYKNGFEITAEQQLNFEAATEARTIASENGVAGVISVNGVMTQAPDYMAMFFGGGNTTYPEIIAALQSFDANANIDRITMEINSPGGEVAGLFEVFSAMEAVSKPIDVVVTGTAASAAYGLATQGDTITATSPASIFGSVGVVQNIRVREDVVAVTSTEAPDKRPDVTTAEGQAVVRSQLDEMHALFAGAIAKGRGTTVDNVNATFGRGGIVLAQRAVELGMIDCISDTAFNIKASQSASAGSNQASMEEKMDLDELKAKHPALYEAVYGQGKEAGIAAERDRATAHLIYGAKGKCIDTAIKAVEEGTELTETLKAKYATSAQDVQAQAKRVEGDKDVNDALEGSAESDDQTQVDQADAATAKLFEEKYGV